MEGCTGHQITPRRRLLPASTRARFMPLRQRLRGTAPAFTPTPRTSVSLHPNASMHRIWPQTQKNADGSTRQIGIESSSPDSMRSSPNRSPHERKHPGQGRARLRRINHHRPPNHLHRRRRTRPRSAAPRSTATHNSAPSSTNTEPDKQTPEPSAGWPPTSLTFAPPSKPSPKASNGTRNNYARSRSHHPDDEPFRPTTQIHRRRLAGQCWDNAAAESSGQY